jgi:hypothetical protein
MAVHPERAARLAERVANLVALRARPKATIMVASTGDRPRSEASHCSRFWNSTAWAAR